MTHYQIIHDESEIQAFENWLPELKLHEIYLGGLFSRKKYEPFEIKSSEEALLSRFTFKKGELLRKLKRLEVPYGAFELGNKPASQRSLVLYIKPNPRNVRIATFHALNKLTTCLMNEKQQFNPEQKVLSAIQDTRGSKFVTSVDIDTKNLDLNLLSSILPDASMYKLIETRGGFHIHFAIQEIKRGIKQGKVNKQWFREVMKTYPIDKTGDFFTPCPGTIQGGFVPKFISQ